MTAAQWLLLIFSTLGGIPASKAPLAEIQPLLDQRLIQPVQAGHAVYYTVPPTGYAQFVSL